MLKNNVNINGCLYNQHNSRLFNFINYGMDKD